MRSNPAQGVDVGGSSFCYCVHVYKTTNKYQLSKGLANQNRFDGVVREKEQTVDEEKKKRKKKKKKKKKKKEEKKNYG